ncbi:MAG TPA: glycosyltransferase family 4 protein [Nitrospira sp.]|nr:glycosyltransferase family 4 protein [Nitrospira sp.]HRB16222.1 glycosyltransferase family 4 protein [Nitrospira sp.]HRB81207.1 glycosyltransferase family 4 protein [Nitrospira sp.]
MTVTYFSKSSSIGPSSRYRVFQFLPHFQAAGIGCRVEALFGETYFSILKVHPRALRTLLKIPYVLICFLRRLWTLLTLGKRDLIVIEGQLFPYAPPLAERLLRWCRYRVAIEMDDAIYLTPGHEKKIPALLSMATGAIVGNDRLAAYAKQFSPRVCVVPTVVDTERFKPDSTRSTGSSAQNSDAITIVWIGLAYNLKYLDVLAPALRALQSRFRLTLRVVCSRPPHMPGVEIEFRPWDFQREVADLQDATIGVMPLEDTEWARGKCGLKLLQYLAVGVPSVASPVGVNRDIIANGENGFLAATEQEWYERLETLCRQPQLRARMGQAGRRTVEEQYSLAVWGPRLGDVYRTLAGNEHVNEIHRAVHSPVSGHRTTGTR